MEPDPQEPTLEDMAFFERDFCTALNLMLEPRERPAIASKCVRGNET